MGYSGLEHFVDSDNASDLAYCAATSFLKVLNNGFKEKANHYIQIRSVSRRNQGCLFPYRVLIRTG